MTAQDASPTTDITVRAMSTKRSTPAMTATYSMGIPTSAKIMDMKASDPPGMPGVPIEAIVAVNAIPKYMPFVKWIPQHAAMKTVVTQS